MVADPALARLQALLPPLLAAALLAGCQSLGDGTGRHAGEDILVVAHRACWRQAAENSLEGIRACIRQGVDIAEVDVRATRDGMLVLMHDPTVDRMTNGSGPVSQLTWAEMQHLRLKAGRGGPSAPVTRYRVPTLAEALRVARGHILLELDIKDAPKTVMAFLRDHGSAETVVLATDTGFDPGLDVRWRLHLDRQETGFPRFRLPDGARPFAVSAAWGRERDPAEAAARVRDQGLRVWSATLTGRRDSPAVWEAYIRRGRCAIHTDRPATLLRYLQARQARDEALTSALPATGQQLRQ